MVCLLLLLLLLLACGLGCFAEVVGVMEYSIVGIFCLTLSCFGVALCLPLLWFCDDGGGIV